MENSSKIFDNQFLDFRNSIKSIINEALVEFGLSKQDAKEHLNKEEAAQFLKVSLSTFQNLMRSKSFPIRKIGKRPFFFKHELISWLENRGSASNKHPKWAAPRQQK